MALFPLLTLKAFIPERSTGLCVAAIGYVEEWHRRASGPLVKESDFVR